MPMVLFVQTIQNHMFLYLKRKVHRAVIKIYFLKMGSADFVHWPKRVCQKITV